MYDLDVILSTDRLSSHRALVDCFTKKVIFRKPRFSELEFENDRKVLPMCTIKVLSINGAN